jgi:hypothetical protein
MKSLNIGLPKKEVFRGREKRAAYRFVVIVPF